MLCSAQFSSSSSSSSSERTPSSSILRYSVSRYDARIKICLPFLTFLVHFSERAPAEEQECTCDEQASDDRSNGELLSTRFDGIDDSHEKYGESWKLEDCSIKGGDLNSQCCHRR